MPLRISCPACKATFAIDASLRGKRVACPECRKALAVPAAKAPPAESNQASPAAIREAKSRPESSEKVRPSLPRSAAREEQREPFHDESVERRHGIGLLLVLAICGISIFSVVLMLGAATLVYLNFLSPDSAKAVQPATIVPSAKSPAKITKVEPEDIPEAPKEKPKKAKEAGKSAVPGPSGQLDREVLDKVKRATVYLKVTLPNGRVTQGSGFFGIDPGLVLTNAHVLGMLNANSLMPRSVEIVYKSGEADSRTYLGKVLGVDRESDLALLRVSAPDLPEPLEVKNAIDLVETQSVYVVGFPFGASLGKNITVSQSSVSSLRKNASGQVTRVQVNGGMHPGNSGGPVVNANGEVIGVAVSVIEATQINFAVPGELVHVVLGGRVLLVTDDDTSRKGEEVLMPLSVNLLDPLNRISKLMCEWWVAPSGQKRPESDRQPLALPGDSEHKKVELTIKAGRGAGDIALPSVPHGHVVWVQPITVDAKGKQRWWSTTAFIPQSAPEPVPALLRLKHVQGARPLQFVIDSQLKLISPGSEDVLNPTQITAVLSEAMLSQEKDEAAMRYRYLEYEFALPTEKLKKLLPSTRGLHADLTLDEHNNTKKNIADTAKVPKALQKESIELHKQLQQAMESLSVPLPGRLTQPGETWTAQRPLTVFVGDRGKSTPMEVTYTYQGVRQLGSKSQAVIGLKSSVNNKLEEKLDVKGTITGTAYLDLAWSQFTMADLTADVTLTEGKGKTIAVHQKNKMDRRLGKELLNIKGKLTNADSRNPKGFPQQVHEISIQSGGLLVLSLESPDSKSYFDTQLRLEDYKGNLIGTDDNSGVDENSLLFLSPREAGNYRVIVSGVGGAVGDYSLIVRHLH